MKARVLPPIMALLLAPLFALAQAQVQYQDQAQAQAVWLTLVGNPGDPQSDIVEIQPQSLPANPGFASYNVRVNRAMQRTSWDGVPYRSYTSSVLIDCAEKTGRYLSIAFHLMPLWHGKPHTTSAFSAAEPRPMQFRSIEPNPTQRIIRAACLATPAR